MDEKTKNELLKALALRELITKGKLQFYVKYRFEIPEGSKYADERINFHLDELTQIWAFREELKNS
ncbi:MAG: hypothetical protein K9J37_04585 [Saprospiraceae bacterium]|nr:hypothetical protein [Saprospiraceae bacterium]MCF8249163.1 hypothetical protein [Saprospiraceae bacterium]MCF8278895.1 hypothetical protein [Bacteroidales bacterium]MCF8311292.1 hypothetical protein [Saprospiraceae bacterium]MCF8440144.1 hypothetical protein [Saprospiraceae bacterium]